MKENYFLAKWLNGEISEEELKKHLSEEEINDYKKIISTSKNFKAPEFDEDKTFEKIKLNSKKSKVKKLPFLKFAYRAAAILIITFSTYYFLSDKNTSFKTQLAEKITFELPDKSTVNLNADSEITYNKDWNTSRSLELSGEAYFKVKKGSKFSVNTNQGKIQVLGTQFNVQVRNSFFEVKCYEGLVSVEYNNEIIQLPAGNSFKVLDSEDKISTNITDLNPSWVQNKSSFNSIPFKLVVEELERQFDVQIDFNLKNENTLYTGSFTHNNLETALKAITIPLNLNFTIFNNKKVKLN